ncbi:hypothetical protein K4L44_00860 [Halosquirtibacter laminarini]|uniref:Uncharacterized protein n=1 Tax=Halosquirtibacter laminarini TaxID=3374600 RepID=A0AC61NP14_9BACT|nr:hypothetical protein K4L44_00860 [Prolixibacteraceae bacterium]
MSTVLGLMIPLLIITISSYIIWKGTDLFDGAASYLGRNLSEGIKGATINAIGSSMPEFLSTLIFLFYLDNSSGLSGGIGITAGSAIFNLLVIPIAIMWTLKFRKMDTTITLSRKIVLRDGISLPIINILLLAILSEQLIRWYHGLLLTLSYLIYLFIIYLELKRSKKDCVQINSDEYEIEMEVSKWKRFISLDFISLMFPHRKTSRNTAIIYLIYTVLVVSIGTWLLVYAIEQIGSNTYHFAGLELNGLGLPTVFVSLILGAAASSVPDTILSVKDALKGNHRDAISNCIGSNIFDISFALGLPILIYTLVQGGPIVLTPFLSKLNVDLWIILLVINLITISAMLIRGCVDKKIGVLMTVLYIVFLVYVVFISLEGEIVTFVS